MALTDVKSEFQIDFDDLNDARIVMNALEPEIATTPSDRSSTQIKLVDKTLIINIKADDAASLRANVNSYLRWIMLSHDVINLKKNV